MTETHLTTKRFDSFDLDLSILQGLADAGFSYCTPIQAATRPASARCCALPVSAVH